MLENRLTSEFLAPTFYLARDRSSNAAYYYDWSADFQEVSSSGLYVVRKQMQTIVKQNSHCHGIHAHGSGGICRLCLPRYV